jgi:hypothetical protein
VNVGKVVGGRQRARQKPQQGHGKERNNVHLVAYFRLTRCFCIACGAQSLGI